LENDGKKYSNFQYTPMNIPTVPEEEEKEDR
jgi:hypothetical protein